MSPTVLRVGGFRLFFFSREEARCHIHVETSSGEAKFWLEPELEMARNHGLTRREIKDAETIIETHHDDIVHAWRRHFGS